MHEFQAQGYSCYNDINRDWIASFPRAREEAHKGQKVAISDLIENDPWQCAKNCLFRFLYQRPYRPLLVELQRIRELSPAYAPYGDIRPVPKADEQVPAKLP